jgi:cell wall-associated NlpC family hydrolase
VSDRRITAANGRVAAAELRGQVTAQRFVEGEAQRVAVAVADLRAGPGGKRDRQLSFGDGFRVLETRDGWCFGTADNGYAGYLREADLDAPVVATHYVAARSTHIYPEADFKTGEVMPLGFGSKLCVVHEGERFCELSTGGFVPRKMLAPVDALFCDPVEVAERFEGVPYLWGGNSIWGIDCSGLVQMALNACGRDCPGDADMQERATGQAIGDNVKPERGDLFFWAGHVGWISGDNRLLHANVHHMAVVEEPLDAAIERIAAQGDGPVTTRKRIQDFRA